MSEPVDTSAIDNVEFEKMAGNRIRIFVEAGGNKLTYGYLTLTEDDFNVSYTSIGDKILLKAEKDVLVGYIQKKMMSHL